MSLPVITYGAHTVDFNTVPESSITAMLRRGVSHLFGSEMASKVTAFFDPDQETPPEDTAEARAVKKAEFQAEAFAKLIAGTIGISTRGPAVDPFVTVLRKLAKKEIVDILKQNGVAWPKKAEDIVETPDGSKYTGPQLIDRRLAGPHGDRLNKEAKKAVEEAARKAKKAEEAAKAEGLSGL